MTFKSGLTFAQICQLCVHMLNVSTQHLALSESIHKHTCTGHRGSVYALAPWRDHRHFLSAGGDAWIVSWSLDAPDTGTLLASVETQVFSLCALPDGKRLVAGNMNGGLHWINLEEPTATRNLQHHGKGVFDLLVLGDRLYSAGGEGMLTRWDIHAARTVESLHLTNQALRCIAHEPSRNLLAVGSSDRHIYLLQEDNLQLVRQLSEAHLNSVFSLAWSPDGRFLLSGGRDALLKVWDAEQDFALVSEQPAHWFTINHIAFSPDGRHFATASRDKTIKLWDAENFQLLKVLDAARYGGHFNSVNRLLWLSDALVSASDDRTIGLWGMN